MNKKEFVSKVMEKTGLNKSSTEKFINAFLDIVAATLAEGDKIQLVGFGTFETHDRAARTARNPKTGEAINIPATTVPAFKAGKAFKEAVNK